MQVRMVSNLRLRAGVAVCLAYASLCAVGGAVQVAVNTNATYQTIKGYGCANFLPIQVTPGLRAELLREMVEEFGINRLRIEIPAGNFWNKHRWERSNDNGDPESIDWSALNCEDFDENIVTIVQPIKRLVEARGETFDSYVSPSFFDNGSSGTAPPWLLRSPGEYAEFAMSLLLRLRDVHGIEATYYCICNEAGNNNGFTAGVVQGMIKALGPKMEAAGLRTRIAFPESVNVDGAWNYINSTSGDSEMWSHVGTVSYHLYGAKTQLQTLRDFAWAKGLPTGQTEYDAANLNTTILHGDLTTGGCSYWEIYGMPSQLDFTGDKYNRLVRQNYYWPFRQLTHYVRPGAVRVAATSDSTQVRVLAFLQNARTVVVVFNDVDATTRTVDLSGLTPGVYGVCRSTSKAAYTERGLQTVGAGGTLSLSIPGSTVLTVYPYAGANQPPTVTDWKPSVGYLVVPSSTFTLSAAAQDPEGDPIAYLWTLQRAPAGATVALATPGVASCAVSGLTVAGDHVFDVAVSDPTHTVRREVRLTVFAADPPPIPFDIHNRIPVQITLPTSSATIRSTAWDLGGTALTYAWSVESQPAGAAAVIASTSSNNTTVSGLTVAGNYVLRVDVSDGPNTVTERLTVPVYPVDTEPAVVSASVSPNNITLPVSSTTLSATTTDADGDVLTHWWTLMSAPAGARPVIANPTSLTTPVHGLLVPGTYSFRLTVADRNDDYNDSYRQVTVNAGAAPQLLHVGAPRGGATFATNQAVNIRWSSTTNFIANVRVEFFDGTVWSDIVASTANDGIEPWTTPAEPCSNCRVRVSDAADGSPSDESDATFSVVTSWPRIDADADTLPDGWEVGFFDSVNGTDGLADGDADGATDGAEYVADTVPTDGQSLLRVLAVSREQGGLRVRWQGGVEVRQTLQRRTSLGSGDWQPVFTNNPPTSLTAEVGGLPLADDVGFFRIRAER